jgi:DNA-binding YbaB/EbfC family protein
MGLMKQAQGLQTKIQKMQEELAGLEVTGKAGGDLVRVTLNGKGEVRAVKIDSVLAKPDEIEILEDLIMAAFQDAKSKAEQAMQSKMQEATAGLPIPPGMKLF